MKNILNIFGSIYNFIKKNIGHPIILLMLGIALSLPLSLYLGVVSINSIFKNISISPKITIYLNLSANEFDIGTIKNNLKKFENIENIKFVDKDSALKEMIQNIGQEKLLSILNSNPLPDVFIITTNTKNPKDISSLVSKLKNLQMVDDVQIDANWVKTLYKVNNLLWKILSFLAITLCLAFILVNYNTIRFQILSKKDEIEISRLLGASSAYIRKPFLLQSFIQSVITYIISVLFSSIIIYKVTKSAINTFNNYGISINFRWFSINELLIILILISLLALSSSWWAVKNHLLEFKQKYQ